MAVAFGLSYSGGRWGHFCRGPGMLSIEIGLLELTLTAGCFLLCLLKETCFVGTFWRSGSYYKRMSDECFLAF